MKFKIGQKVKIRRDLVNGNLYGNRRYYDEMDVMGNIVYTIIRIYEDDYSYLLDKSPYFYSEEMLEPFTSEKTENTIITTRNENAYLVVRNKDDQLIGINLNGTGFIEMDVYNEYFSHTSGNKQFDVMSIYPIAKGGFDSIFINSTKEEPIWKREEVKELTVKQISELLGYRVKVVE